MKLLEGRGENVGESFCDTWVPFLKTYDKMYMDDPDTMD